MKKIFLGLSTFVAICTLLLVSILLLSSGPSGNVTIPGDLSFLVALFFFLCGNLICFILNLIACWQGFRRPWFINILAVQGSILIICLLCIASFFQEQFRYRVANKQLDTIHAAIKRDDLQDFFAAKKACGFMCGRLTSDLHELLYASQSKAHHIATWIVGNGVKITNTSAPTWWLKTCEGIDLNSVNALGMAVANEDLEMLDLLLPIADSYIRYEALILSARLGRLEMLQWLVAHDIPLDSPYRYSHDKGRRLLEAAARGAAWNTARWLIDTQGVPIEKTKGGMNSLLWNFIILGDNTDSPDAKLFLMLLVEKGINLDASDKNGKTSLQWAIGYGLRNTVRFLIEAGADTHYLNEDQQKALHALLTEQQDDRRRHLLQTEDCVKIDRNFSRNGLLSVHEKLSGVSR